MNVESLSSVWRGNLSCEDCSTRLTVFRKKKICYFCKCSFCQVCILRREDKKLCCKKCQILTARPLDKSKLLSLKSRDIIKYLTSRQIPTNGCVEKEDLVNVLIKAVNNSCFHPSSSACLDDSTKRDADNSSASSSASSGAPCNSPSSSGAPSGSRTKDFYRNADNLKTGMKMTDAERDKLEGECSGQRPRRRGMFYPVRPEDFSDDGPELLRLGNEYVEDSLSGQIMTVYCCRHTCSRKPQTGFFLIDKTVFANIKSSSELEALSVKQLKDILRKNRISFKGCLEKAELLQKVVKLWNELMAKKREVEKLSLDELCKICMDAPIECVLLECGHMTTCVPCGRQLVECPICRQFVVRCVRTFKA